MGLCGDPAYEAILRRKSTIGAAIEIGKGTAPARSAQAGFPMVIWLACLW